MGCQCHVCTSTDTRDQRLRASLILTASDGQQVLIDTGPDLRQQMLRIGAKRLAGVLYTHFHYDHLAGLDDLRPFSFDNTERLKCFANLQTHEIIVTRYPYLREQMAYTTVPQLDVLPLTGNEEDGYNEFEIGGLIIQPIRLTHIPKAGVLSTGFVVNGKFGYLTDFKEIHPEDQNFLMGLEALYLGSPLNKPHVSHISHAEALELIAKFSPRTGYIGHLSHFYSHAELTSMWAPGVMPAHDGLVLKF